MGLNAKEFASLKKVSSRKIKKWFDAGYLGAAVKDEKTGVYDIPADTPIPFKADCRISHLKSFWKQILNAAESQNSLYESMYPRLQPGTFDRYIKDFVEAGFIRVQTTESGAKYLELCVAGDKYLNELTEKEQTEVFSLVEKGIAAGTSFINIISVVWPVILPYLQSVPIK